MSWVHGLVAADERVRSEALARHLAQIEASGTGTLPGLLAAFMASAGRPGVPDPEAYPRLAPHAVLFLEWERRFPSEWRESWTYSPWTAKLVLLRTFTRSGVPDGVRPALVDLLLSVVHRRQRCQDHWYTKLARRLDDAPLRERLRAAADGGDERTRLRARFVLWALDHPTANVDGRAWRRWLREVVRPLTQPASAAELSAMAPAAVASLLAEMTPGEIGRVLEGLHTGPAARVLAAIRPLRLAASAVASMDASLARRVLRTVDQPAAAAILAELGPAVAGPRFPGPGRADLLELMGSEADFALLAAMPAATAAEHIRHRPPDSVAAMLSRMDAEAAAAILTWRGERAEVLNAMGPPASHAVFAALPARIRARYERGGPMSAVSQRV
ncbi:hypothetical protein SAMN05421684_5018 [Asanoa ishikariensis]|uniref:MgtE intracellular N domain-containing protein n=1 Tax=Asanoa ishikariensis TaxID=137265 RepID=A0A1H3T0E0_9ACTN|nr:hypothetical protein [Asanoa ishikariensis]SDZ43736.1 hypothetical protein SAMN05421684_5018 [Asanoa ishikariensis]